MTILLRFEIPSGATVQDQAKEVLIHTSGSLSQASVGYDHLPERPAGVAKDPSGNW